MSARVALTVAEMTETERRYTLAMHDLFCDEEPKGHDLSEHEPFDDPGSLVPWDEVMRAFERRGVALFHVPLRASAPGDETP